METTRRLSQIAIIVIVLLLAQKCAEDGPNAVNFLDPNLQQFITPAGKSKATIYDSARPWILYHPSEVERMKLKWWTE